MPYSKEFGDVFKRLVAASGKSYRQVAIELDVHRATPYEYAKGQVPSEGEKVHQLIEVLCPSPGDADELLVAAGLKQPSITPEAAAEQLLSASADELTYERADTPVFSQEYGGQFATLSPAGRLAVEKILEADRKKARKLAE